MSQWMRDSFVAAELGDAVAEREVDGAVDLLVEEGVLHVARDAGVAADPELAEAPRALVGVERLEQEVLVRLGGRVDDPAALEAQADAAHLAAAVDGRELGERDRALGRVLDRAAEELAARDVRAAGVDLHRAPGDGQPEVGLGADDPHLLGGVEAVGVALHALALGVPVEQAGAVEEVRELLRRHARVLRERRRRVLAADPRPARAVNMRSNAGR